jgi:hypothetical protein
MFPPVRPVWVRVLPMKLDLVLEWTPVPPLTGMFPPVGFFTAFADEIILDLLKSFCPPLTLKELEIPGV